MRISRDNDSVMERLRVIVLDSLPSGELLKDLSADAVLNSLALLLEDRTSTLFDGVGALVKASVDVFVPVLENS